MPVTTKLCPSPATRKEKSWEYQQYYLGTKDEEHRKCGEGQHLWTGAQSLESYTGHFLRDTMHGLGDYRWRHLGSENVFFTYEGYFFCNRMHGYGTMSYPDGRTFSGLFFNNVRWGPGVQSHADLHEDVGLWRGGQLMRLAWRPEGFSIVPEFVNTITGRIMVESHRIVLTTEVETIDDTAKAIELLKQCGADPWVAMQKWSKVYPKYCTDLASPLCYTESFDRDYYNGKKHTLKEVDFTPEKMQDKRIDEETTDNVCTYYAWNNNNMIVNMMKHSYKHERQLTNARMDLKSILSGPRRKFKPPADHEIDCRTLLMASYLDHIEDVAHLVNVRNVHPDITDIQGNSAIMYATVGDQSDIIHFLVEAGANVDSYNDSCCTPLGVALMRYVCAENDIPPSEMFQALLPPSLGQAPAPVESMILDWNITREQISNTSGVLTKSPSKSNRIMSSKKIKSALSIKDQPGSKRKPDIATPKVLGPVYESYESISEDKTLYNSINREYSIKIADIFTPLNVFGTGGPVPYVFHVTDMIKEGKLDTFEDDPKRPPEKAIKKMLSSKTLKDARKISKEVMWQHSEKENISTTSAEKIKANTLSKIMSTILQLLSDGANPKFVRCPQPALLMAVLAGSTDLIRQLVHYGADINENYDKVFGYCPLDVAISRTLTHDNLEIVRVILECGADTQHRLVYEQDHKDKDPAVEQILGPTLLHIVLAKNTESGVEEDIRHQLLELLLKYNCNPMLLYNGRAAIDVAMSKGNEVLNIFIKNPKTDLNAVINKFNQSILVKMFSFPYFKSITSTERLQSLTDLLLFGADPLLKCQNYDKTYQNIFVFTKNTLIEIDQMFRPKTASPLAVKTSDTKAGKKAEKLKKDDKTTSKQLGKSVDDIEDYKQAVELVTDCARLIYIRWLQAKLMKQLVVIIDKYKHRHWNMILKSFQNTRSAGLWLTPQRCLEIWDILSDTRKNIYKDQRNLTHLLCIVIYLAWQNYGRLTNDVLPDTTLTASIKDAIEADVGRILRQHKADKNMKAMFPWKLSYVKPELVKDGAKFNVCFECILPLTEEKILCSWCKQIYFCSYDCMKANVYRSNCHPCSDYLKLKYFSSSVESF